MRIAYLDCFSGISGDMFLGALVDAGVPFELFEHTVATLNVGATLERSHVTRNGIAATKIDVLVNGVKDMPRDEFWATNLHQDESATVQSHSHGRHLSSILKIIAATPISERARQNATATFNTLGEAEAKIHKTSVEKIHFHEVGAADAIVDIVCAAVGAEELRVDQIMASPLNVGSGTVRCAHGVMPVPAPATLEILKGVPIYSGEVAKELVTPTGAAIARTLVSRFSPRPVMETDQIGYGAGSHDFEGHSNVLRLVCGELREEPQSTSDDGTTEEIIVLEANLDDLNPQVIGYASERLLAAGALDVFTTSVFMKKGRLGSLLTVLAKPSNEAGLRDILFRETTTLGVRSCRENRHVLPRHHETVRTAWGEVRIKVASRDGADSNVAPEYEDCRRISVEHNVALKVVMQEALRQYLEKKNG
jgi:uncharacterized protein (TIGR00299 family) protein